MDFEHRLYELRRARGISQEELANVVGVSRQAVQKWESGVSKPDMDNLVALSDYFTVTLDYLLKGTDTPSAQATAQPSPTIINNYYHDQQDRWSWHYEYRSKRTLFGIPLVHVNLGYRKQWARGIVAVGNISTGVVSLGLISAGLLSMGALSLGLLTLGGVALGLCAGGGFALGGLALGGVAIGRYAVGGLAMGGLAIGGAAIGNVAIGGTAEGTLALLTNGSVSPEVIQAAVAQATEGLPEFLRSFLSFLGSV